MTVGGVSFSTILAKLIGSPVGALEILTRTSTATTAIARNMILLSLLGLIKAILPYES
jgi:hypothetical protein